MFRGKKYLYSKKYLAAFVFLVCVSIAALANHFSYFLEKVPLKENETVLCTTFAGGLGNNLFQFASSFCIAQAKHMQFMIDRNAVINKFFKLDVKFAPSERFCKSLPSRVEKDGLYATYDPQLSHFSAGQNLRIGDYLQSWKYFIGFERQIRKQLTFRDDIQKNVNITVAKILRKFTIQSRANVTLIGVHVRRSDMVNNKLGFTVAADDYIQKAVDLVLKKYKNVIFIVVSKEKKWTEKKMPRYVNSVFVSGNRAFDMAMLASCDHTVMTVGTFGWWGAWLAGGDVIYYKEPAIVGSWWYKKLKHADHFYPNWIGLK